MAGAVLDLFPEAKFGFGPPVQDGFYYDFDLPRPLTPEDLGKIEAKMREVVKEDKPFEHHEMAVPEALKFFGNRKQDYKVDQIKKLAEKGADEDSDDEVKNGKVSVYQHNGFVDLCRGPHVERTGKIGPFKLLSIAGAYWRGNERNPQLQRIYGTVWPDQKQLDDYLKRLQEIERRDHRVLGKELELFRIDDELGSGLVLWLPNLSVVREELENWWRRLHHERGYTLVYTPHIANEKIYQRSGHPEKRLGTDEMWDKAEKALADALGVREVPYKIDEGGGVFYAPKIDIKMKDAIGREWQGPTIQVDLNLPERFDVTFVNDKGERERAVMIHRVLFGSLERFVGGLIEHYAGNFPLWLNWEQVADIPVRESALDYARDIAKKLRAEDFRVHLDEQAGDLRNRVKEAQQRKANYMLVVGDKEAAAGTVSVRRRGSRDEERGVTLDAFVDRIKKERDSKALPPDFAQHEPTAGDAMA